MDVCMYAQLLSQVQLLATPWTVARQAPLSKWFFRQEYWSGLPFTSPRDLPDPGIEPGSPTLQADFYHLSHQGKKAGQAKFMQNNWIRLLRVPWTARRSNQSILKEISPEYSLEGLMLKLKFQYFGHLRWRANSLEKTLMLGRIEGRRRGGWQRTKWLMASSTYCSGLPFPSPNEFELLLRDGEGQGSLECCSPWGHKKLDVTEQLNNHKVLSWNQHKFSIVIPTSMSFGRCGSYAQPKRRCKNPVPPLPPGAHPLWGRLAPGHTRGCRWIPRQLCNSLSVTDRQVSQSMDALNQTSFITFHSISGLSFPALIPCRALKSICAPASSGGPPSNPVGCALALLPETGPPSCWGPWEMIAVAGHSVHFWRQWFHGHLFLLGSPQETEIT